MARAATTSDAFNAVAEPQRRRMLECLAGGELPVGELAIRLQMAQPSVSKHLGTLRQAGLVRARRRGRHVLYCIRPEAVAPIRDWVRQLERLWSHQLLRIKQRAEDSVGLESQENKKSD